MARYVEDLNLILPIIAGPDWRDPGLIPMPLVDPGTVDLNRLNAAYYIDNGIVTPTPATVEVLQASVAVLKEAGVTMEEDRPTEVTTTATMWMELMVADGSAWIHRLLAEAGTTETHSTLQNRYFNQAGISTGEFTALLSELDQVRSNMLAFIEDYDLIICPTNAFPAMPHGQVSAKGDGYTYTRIYNLTGWPAAVVRGGSSPDGLPIGVQIIGRPWREDVVLAVAQRLEMALGGWQRSPIL
jgi:amidase